MTDSDTPKFIPPIIELIDWRLSFPRLDKLETRPGPNGQVRAGAKPRVDCTLLGDPSNVEHQKQIAAIKQAAFAACIARWGSKENFPKPDPRTGMGGLIFAYGLGNELKKVYDGYKDMFYLKTQNTQLPILGDRRGNQIQLHTDGAYHIVDKDGNVTPEKVPPNQVPFGGCYVRARVSPFTYAPSQKNPESASGVNFNIRVVQFMRIGAAFGGGAPLSASDELQKLAGDAPASKPVSDDPWA